MPEQPLLESTTEALPSKAVSSGPPTWQDRLDLLTSAGRRPSRVVLAGAVIVGVAAVLAVLLLRQPAPPPPELSLPRAGAGAEPSVTSTTVADDVVAHAAGAVRAPGVYTLAAGARVGDLLTAAGGAIEGADLNRVNLAAVVVDGSRVYLPLLGEAVPTVVVDEGAGAGTGDADGGAVAGPVDLNTATAEQLDTLPGVGPATAAAILDERERRGRFASVDELLEVRGIGDAKLADLRDLVRAS